MIGWREEMHSHCGRLIVLFESFNPLSERTKIQLPGVHLCLYIEMCRVASWCCGRLYIYGRSQLIRGDFTPDKAGSARIANIILPLCYLRVRAVIKFPQHDDEEQK